MPAPIHASKEFVKHFFTTEVVEDRPIAWEVALHTRAVGHGDDFEVAQLNYARADANFVSYEDPQGRGFWEAKNTVDVTFQAAGVGEEYTVTHYTIRDKTNGQCLAIGELSVPIPVVEGTVVTFPIGYLKVRGI